MFQSTHEIEAMYARITSFASASLAVRLMNKTVGVAARADRSLGKTRRHRRPGRKIQRQLELASVVQIKKSLRRGRRAVRLYKTTRDEKRLILVAAQIFNRAVRRVIIAVAFTVAIQHYDAIRIRRAAQILRQRSLRQLFAGLAGSVFVEFNTTVRPPARAGVGLAFSRRAIGLVPRLGIVNAAVENFSAPQ